MERFGVAAVFSDYMVLQRNKKIKVFGFGVDGEEVSVSLGNEVTQATIKDGRWIATLPPFEAGTGYEMKVICGMEEIVFKDIAIGEVWLAGGQSNMEWELQSSTDGQEALEQDQAPNVRFYNTPKNAHMDEKFYEMEKASKWEVFGDEGTRTWSAVGYFYGKKLAKELDVTVGIIGCNWGGTSASAWISREALAEDQELTTYLDIYENAIVGKSKEQQYEDYMDYLAYAVEWDKRANACYAERPKIRWNDLIEVCGECRWPGPLNYLSPFRPAGLYECMLQRVIPYTLGGFIYYQGESDDHKPQMYQKLLTRVIRQWREDWEEDTLPFLLVQLTMHKGADDPDYKHWCLLREAQMRTYQTVRNTGIAVITDCGAYDDIHPRIKAPVGERLALQALHSVFGMISAQEAFGPMYKDMILRGKRGELLFDYSENGFLVKGDGSGFEIAGEDKIYHPAKVEICENRIYVSSEDVTEPKYARYCWTNYGDVNYYGQNGLPMAPFRTSRDDK